MGSTRKRYARTVMVVQGNAFHPRDPVICFTNKDYEGTLPHQVDPMVISLIAIDYKIEKVLIDQGSFTNVEIRGTTEIETMFGVGASVRTIPVSYTAASYNIIIGQPTLNRLRAIVSTPHLYMKYPIENEVGVIKVDQKIDRQCYKDSLRVGHRPTNYEGASNSQAFVNFLDLDLH
ncbi:hypothetical protein CR513_55158, partial [Mucuna pruriens]